MFTDHKPRPLMFDRNDNYLGIKHFRIKKAVWFGLNFGFVIGVLYMLIAIGTSFGLSFESGSGSFALWIATYCLVSKE